MARDLKGPEFNKIFNRFCKDFADSGKTYQSELTSIIDKYENLEEEHELATVFDISSFTVVKDQKGRRRYSSGEYSHQEPSIVDNGEVGEGDFLVLKEEDMNQTLLELLHEAEPERVASDSDGETISSCSDDSWLTDEEGGEDEEPSSDGYHDYPTESNSLTDSRKSLDAVKTVTGQGTIRENQTNISRGRHQLTLTPQRIGTPRRGDGLSRLKISSDTEDEVDGDIHGQRGLPVADHVNHQQMNLNETYVLDGKDLKPQYRPERDLHKVTSPHNYRKYVDFVTKPTPDTHSYHDNNAATKLFSPERRKNVVNRENRYSQRRDVTESERRVVSTRFIHTDDEFINESEIYDNQKDRLVRMTSDDVVRRREVNNNSNEMNNNSNVRKNNSNVRKNITHDGSYLKDKSNRGHLNTETIKVKIPELTGSHADKSRPPKRVSTIFTPFEEDVKETTKHNSILNKPSHCKERPMFNLSKHIRKEQDNVLGRKYSQKTSEDNIKRYVDDRSDCSLTEGSDNGLLYLEPEVSYKNQHVFQGLGTDYTNNSSINSEMCQSLSKEDTLHQNQSTANKSSLKKDSGISTFHTEDSFEMKTPKETLNKLTLETLAEFNNSLSIVNVSDSKDMSMTVCQGSAVKVEQWLMEMEPSESDKCVMREDQTQLNREQETAPTDQNLFRSPDRRGYICRSNEPIIRSNYGSPHSGGKQASQWNKLADNIIGSCGREKGQAGDRRSPAKNRSVTPAQVFRKLKYGEEEQLNHSSGDQVYNGRMSAKRQVAEMMEEYVYVGDEMEYSPVPAKVRRTNMPVARRLVNRSSKPEDRCIEDRHYHDDVISKSRESKHISEVDAHRRNRNNQYNLSQTENYDVCDSYRDNAMRNESANYNQSEMTSHKDASLERREHIDFAIAQSHNFNSPTNNSARGLANGDIRFYSRKESPVIDIERMSPKIRKSMQALKQSEETSDIRSFQSPEMRRRKSGHNHPRDSGTPEIRKSGHNHPRDSGTPEIRKSGHNHPRDSQESNAMFQSPEVRKYGYNRPRDGEESDSMLFNLPEVRKYGHTNPVNGEKSESRLFQSSDTARKPVHNSSDNHFFLSPEVSRRKSGHSRTGDTYSPSAAMARLKLNTPMSRNMYRSVRGDNYVHDGIGDEVYDSVERRKQTPEKWYHNRPGQQLEWQGCDYTDEPVGDVVYCSNSKLSEGFDPLEDGSPRSRRGSRVDHYNSCDKDGYIQQDFQERYDSRVDARVTGSENIERNRGKGDFINNKEIYNHGSYNGRDNIERNIEESEELNQRERFSGKKSQKRLMYDQDHESCRSTGRDISVHETSNKRSTGQHINIDLSVSESRLQLSNKSLEVQEHPRQSMEPRYSRQYKDTYPQCGNDQEEMRGVTEHDQPRRGVESPYYKQSKDIRHSRQNIKQQTSQSMPSQYHRQNTQQQYTKDFDGEQQRQESVQFSSDKHSIPVSRSSTDRLRQFKVPMSPTVSGRNVSDSPRMSKSSINMSPGASGRSNRISSPKSSGLGQESGYHSSGRSHESAHKSSGLAQRPPHQVSESANESPQRTGTVCRKPINQWNEKRPHKLIEPYLSGETAVKAGHLRGQKVVSDLVKSYKSVLQSSPVRPGARFSLDLTLSTIAGPEETSSEADSRTSPRNARKQGRQHEEDDIQLIDD